MGPDFISTDDLQKIENTTLTFAMSSYGSRVHKVASIFRRVTGLMGNGAMEPKERPLWYDVYKAFPPRVEPSLERSLPANLRIQEILYAEDVGRVAFLQKYENADEDLHNLFAPSDKGTSMAKFITKARAMGADADHTLWTDEAFLDKDLVFLGSGSAYPSPHRAASGLVLRHTNGTQWLFDCGEGTQVQLQSCTAVRAQRISRIFITHLHGDHIFGLPGLLATISGMREHAVDPRWVLTMEVEKDSGPPDLEIYGPRGLRRFLRTTTAISWSLLRMTYVVHELHPRPDQVANCFPYWTVTDLDPVRDRMLPFERRGRDIHPDSDGFFRDIFGARETGLKDGREDFVVHAFMLDHPVPCVGYLLLEPAPLPRLRADKAVALGVKPGPLMGRLKRGEPVTFERDGKEVTVNPVDVLDVALRGRRVAILGDSRDSSELRRLLICLFDTPSDDAKVDNCGDGGYGCRWRLDCLVHEATGHSVEQGDESMYAKGHSTARSAAAFAATMGVRQLVLSHFSQRFLEDDIYAQEHKDPSKYSKVSSLLEDARSCKAFKGRIDLAADLKIIPIIGNVEYEEDVARKKAKGVNDQCS
ncbi:Zinc phosphodiesterase ELAC protein 1 [Taenia solium]|eukprot:TsM_000679000 transcript=TsM_000679000 gene=TsM_000679000